MIRNSQNLLGRCYPFFLNNENLNECHYLYQAYSPRLDDKSLTPLYSLTKVSERTVDHPEYPSGTDVDLLRICAGGRPMPEKTAISYIEDILKRERNNTVYENGGKFPAIEYGDSINNIRTLISSIRDTLRWRNYNLLPGNVVDVLWTTREFLICKICEDDKVVWLEPRALYSNVDTNLDRPFTKFDLSTINLEFEPLKKEDLKQSEISRQIKNIEWSSFSRRAFSSPKRSLS